MLLSPFLFRVASFSNAAHSGVNQVRKYTGVAYFIHPLEVANILSEYTDDENAIAAAMLHDVIEDTGVKRKQIADEFGEDVATLVDELTDISKPEDGNRAVRKLIDAEHTARASDRGQSIKYADIISNTNDIFANDKQFSIVFLKEKIVLLNMMDKGIPALRDRAIKTVYEAAKSLDIHTLNQLRMR